MDKPKYQVGDFVKILYGHPIFYGDGDMVLVQDHAPNLVGREARIDEVSTPQENFHQYALELSDNRISWFNEEQLEPMEKPKSFFVMNTAYGYGGWLYKPWDLRQFARNILKELDK